MSISENPVCLKGMIDILTQSVNLSKSAKYGNKIGQTRVTGLYKCTARKTINVDLTCVLAVCEKAGAWWLRPHRSRGVSLRPRQPEAELPVFAEMFCH